MARARSLPHVKLAAIAALAIGVAGAPRSSRAVDPPTASSTPSSSPAHAAFAHSAAAEPEGAGLDTVTQRRFAAAIADNLPRVPDPPLVLVASDGAGVDPQTLRDRMVRFVREVATGRSATCALFGPARRAPVITLYRAGALVGRGEAATTTSPSPDGLCLALKDATRRALASAGAPSAIDDARFVVELPEQGAFVLEYDGKGLELSHGLVPVRVLDRALMAAQIDAADRYLTRVLDPERGGAHKYYHPSTDRFEDVLHTVYSASTALTFLKLYDHAGDVRDLERAKRATRFVLSMQNRDGPAETRGAFFYSFDTDAAQHDDLLLAGTTSKSIFTLLALHERTKDEGLLDAAVMAADWLTTMQRPDGSVRSSLRVGAGGALTPSRKESLLYTGQVLSALSRVYRVTGDPKYLDAAARTALYLGEKVARQGCYLGDDYRSPNPISSSWVVMSLLDFDRATQDGRFEGTVFRCADELLRRQERRTEDPYRNGRYRGALSSSGNGWIAEVMSEVYLHCRRKGGAGCDRYKDSVVAAARVLVQYTYSLANSFMVKNPEAATGGVFWSSADRWVRTDAVCHATNAYLGVVDDLGEGLLLSLPELPIAAPSPPGSAEDGVSKADEAAAERDD